jgi:hypothetical protein
MFASAVVYEVLEPFRIKQLIVEVGIFPFIGSAGLLLASLIPLVFLLAPINALLAPLLRILAQAAN